jgi:hypothetical protein
MKKLSVFGKGVPYIVFNKMVTAPTIFLAAGFTGGN